MTLVDAITWRTVPDTVRAVVDRAGPLAKAAQQATAGTPGPVWLQPDDQVFAAPPAAVEKLAAADLVAVPGGPDGTGSWLLVKAADLRPADLAHPFAQAVGLAPALWNKPLGGPSPLVAMLASGALGAGAGYYLGRGLEAWLPERFVNPGRIRKTTAVLGGLLGAAGPAYLGTVGMRHPENADAPWKAWVRPNVLFGGDPEFAKAAEMAAGAFLRDIPVDEFGRVLLADPLTPLAVRAAAAGTVAAAGASLGGAGLVSPYDIARTLANAGVGFGTGLVVGKVLGALAGITPAARQALQRTGAAAGLLQSVIPMAFGPQSR